VAALAVVAVGLFGVGLAVGLHCRLHGCTWARDRWFALDSIGGLPRLFTTGLFVAVAAAAWVAARRGSDRPRTWWTAVAVLGAVLAVLKLLSTHSQLKADSAAATLAGGAAGSVVVLTLLWRTARRWGVRAGPPVVAALAVYAFAALGLDAVTGLVGGSGVVVDAVSTFVEELGEALAALLVLTAVWWWLPAGPQPASVRQQ
jgi:uncharacterized membrane protein